MKYKFTENIVKELNELLEGSEGVNVSDVLEIMKIQRLDRIVIDLEKIADSVRRR